MDKPFKEILSVEKMNKFYEETYGKNSFQQECGISFEKQEKCSICGKGDCHHLLSFNDLLMVERLRQLDKILAELLDKIYPLNVTDGVCSICGKVGCDHIIVQGLDALKELDSIMGEKPSKLYFEYAFGKDIYISKADLLAEPKLESSPFKFFDISVVSHPMEGMEFVDWSIPPQGPKDYKYHELIVLIKT